MSFSYNKYNNNKSHPLKLFLIMIIIGFFFHLGVAWSPDSISKVYYTLLISLVLLIYVVKEIMSLMH